MNHCVVKHRTCKTKIVHWCPVQGNVLAFGHLLFCLKDAKHGWNVRKVEFSTFRLFDFSNFRTFDFSNFRIFDFSNFRIFEFSSFRTFELSYFILHQMFLGFRFICAFECSKSRIFEFSIFLLFEKCQNFRFFAFSSFRIRVADAT